MRVFSRMWAVIEHLPRHRLNGCTARFACTDVEVLEELSVLIVVRPVALERVPCAGYGSLDRDLQVFTYKRTVPCGVRTIGHGGGKCKAVEMRFIASIDGLVAMAFGGRPMP